MLFIELRFVLFFLAVLAVHWALRRNGARKLWLLLASYVFYGAWDWRFLSLIVVSTLVDYTAGLALVRPGARRRRWLVGSLVANLGLLGFFKYWGFFVESAAELLGWLGFRAHLPTLAVVLPVGISFYTFQTLSYTLDVYFGRLEPTRNLLDMALFVAFFPQLVAGPIVRARDFLPQLDERRSFARVEVRAALLLFLAGFVKKACISDNLAPIVDAYYASPALYDAASAWTATLFYAVQIYCDFSGYSDMAIACAALLGYELCENFRWPYLAGDITEFWRRWHISLSSWLRDYLYIPLGGSRGSRLFTYRNLMLTMLLGGLWHGAAWNFVVWGGLHGLALVLHREWARRVPQRSPARRLVGAVSMPLTFVFVCLGWVFFRAVGFERALTIARAFLLLDSPGTRGLGPDALWLLPALALVHWIAWRSSALRREPRVPGWVFACGYGLATALVLAFVPVSSAPFIYFQF